jgi:hypothetical protein
MANWLMEVVTGIFSLWAPESYDDVDFWRDPLASH